MAIASLDARKSAELNARKEIETASKETTKRLLKAIAPSSSKDRTRISDAVTRIANSIARISGQTFTGAPQLLAYMTSTLESLDKISQHEREHPSYPPESDRRIVILEQVAEIATSTRSHEAVEKAVDLLSKYRVNGEQLLGHLIRLIEYDIGGTQFVSKGRLVSSAAKAVMRLEDPERALNMAKTLAYGAHALLVADILRSEGA